MSKKVLDPNAAFAARKSDGLCHTSDFCRRHRLVVEQLDNGKFNLLDFETAKPVSAKRVQAFLEDLVRLTFFL